MEHVQGTEMKLHLESLNQSRQAQQSQIEIILQSQNYGQRPAFASYMYMTTTSCAYHNMITPNSLELHPTIGMCIQQVWFASNKRWISPSYCIHIKMGCVQLYTCTHDIYKFAQLMKPMRNKELIYLPLSFFKLLHSCSGHTGVQSITIL